MPAARQIADALHQLSAEHAEAGPPLSAIKLDADTVRKFLDAAASDLENALA
jgi:hypothetical protein